MADSQIDQDLEKPYQPAHSTSVEQHISFILTQARSGGKRGPLSLYKESHCCLHLPQLLLGALRLPDGGMY